MLLKFSEHIGKDTFDFVTSNIENLPMAISIH